MNFTLKKNKKLLSKSIFFGFFCRRRPKLLSILKRFKKEVIPGKIIFLNLALKLIPFSFSLLLKSRFLKIFAFLALNTYLYKGVCISIKKKAFFPSLVLRFVDGGVRVDKYISFGSPLLVSLTAMRIDNRFPVKNFNLKNLKAKLYFLKGLSHKKLMADLYY